MSNTVKRSKNSFSSTFSAYISGRITAKLAALSLAVLPGLTMAKANLLDDLMGNLYTMKAVYSAAYAPTDWKAKFSNYDLDAEFEKAVARARANPKLSYADTKLILKDFVYAMKDYHVSISFVATEAASLPFTIKGVGDKFFIVFIDRTKLPVETFPFKVGDELVEFGGVVTSKAVTEVQSQFTENVSATDRATAELRLTNRTAARGLVIPQGPVTLAILKKGAKVASRLQLIWDYTPEKVNPRRALALNRNIQGNLNFLDGANSGLQLVGDLGRNLDGKFFVNSDVPEEIAQVRASALFKPKMEVSTDTKAAVENPYNLGTKKSFTPSLGAKVWESPDTNYFDAYIYKTADRKLIGYVRIASYSTPDYMKATADFRKIIERFESSTDGMIIDQVNNPGGSVFYLYTLASMLSDQPLKTPRHRMSITQADVFEALKEIEKLKNVKNDEEAKKASPIEEYHGYPSSYEFVQFTLSYARFIVSEWAAGRKLSDPYWIAGVDHINPDPVNYTKPILLLTNHQDYSGGDFFPAILQDNKRVTVFGGRTAGAGGYVNNVTIPNSLGINAFRITQSIAERVDGNPIENLGVTPDVAYEMCAEDYTNNYVPYVKAIQAAMDGLLK